MTDVACFCGCLYAFDGDWGVCPECGEYTSVNPSCVAAQQPPRDELERFRQAADDPRATSRPGGANAQAQRAESSVR